MVSYADNPNYLFIEPFLKWAQELYQHNTGLRIYKRLTNNSRTGSYCVLTNNGKKKTEDPITVYLKIVRIGLETASFDLYDTVAKKHIYFEASNDNFDFNHRAIDDELIKKVRSYREAPYDHSSILESSISATSSPAPSSQSPVMSPSTAPTEAPPTSSSSSSNGGASKLSREIVPQDESEVTLLKKELERTTCELFIYKLERDALLRKLTQPTKNTFKITDYNVIRHLTRSLGIRTYSVEQTVSKKKFTLKEYIFDGYSSDHLKRAVQLEFVLLTELNALPEKSKHINYLLEKSEDLTIIRHSHYFLSEPAILNLEEFSMNYMKKDKSLSTVIITQILEGLSFLDTKCGRIHGNIDASSVVIDSTWTVKLTSFGLSHPLNTNVDPLRLLNGENDLLIKHPYIFELVEEKRPITIKYAIDRWSLGCLFYKLLFDSDLFLTSPSYKTHPAVIVRLVERPYGKIVSAFLNDYMNNFAPGQLLEVDFFKRYRNQNIGAYIHQQQQQQQPQQQPQPQMQTQASIPQQQ
ncbi:hypothetical protein WICANDRAFT_94345 [Wickerhamomyces anomalus NRRL Y-366-8]|uniref:non-specific serine/threonine protein kinase n=1 Tax=Wickerhamomyces anomalus (strain ATCC 58044 / CBS 1984 / NCYC 433 / NRRL Y-366-8) TaxID=683960 RepID=A0A1E3P1A1_WICAA|nr:uncharacterized protein WICANDRAFT_94345 [Wickerhamomyces anomalus NRRL Y-366-8]ODQ59259.1 hypothetical protein WICANDRAFT_94345 [Wickerhamomyces anomalus NRRL Y-366-8]